MWLFSLLCGVSTKSNSILVALHPCGGLRRRTSCSSARQRSPRTKSYNNAARRIINSSHKAQAQEGGPTKCPWFRACSTHAPTKSSHSRCSRSTVTASAGPVLSKCGFSWRLSWAVRLDSARVVQKQVSGDIGSDARQADIIISCRHLTRHLFS